MEARICRAECNAVSHSVRSSSVSLYGIMDAVRFYTYCFFYFRFKKHIPQRMHAVAVQ